MHRTLYKRVYDWWNVRCFYWCLLILNRYFDKGDMLVEQDKESDKITGVALGSCVDRLDVEEVERRLSDGQESVLYTKGEK